MINVKAEDNTNNYRLLCQNTISSPQSVTGKGRKGNRESLS